MAERTTLLRDAREGAGLSLDELSARTRIKPHFLDALERGEFERLPGAFFARAFLRTCARELGLSPEIVLRAYGVEPTAELADATREHAPVSEEPTPAWRPAAAWVALPLAAVLLWGGVALLRPDPEPAIAPNDVGEAGAVATTGPGIANALPPAHATPGQAEPLALEIRANAETWITATADGRRVVYRLLQPGEHVSLEAADALSVRVGNAAALEYTINGQPGIALGPPGAVRTVHVTRENYRTFQR